MNCNVFQIGSHVGNTSNDYIFDKVTSNDFCIFVEPILEYYNKLIENYNTTYPNNNFKFLNVACSDKNDKIILYKPIIDKDLPIWSDQLTSVLSEHTKNHNLNIDTLRVEVECKTIDSIIKEYNIESIDLLSVDTEGHDFEVLQGINLKKIKPKEIVFEHKHIDGTNKSFGFRYHKIINYLSSNGYVIVKQTGDDTFMKLKNG
jgi:FkbM family methyltransferase